MLKNETVKDLFRQQLEVMKCDLEEIEEFLNKSNNLEEVLIDDSLANVIRLLSSGELEELMDVLIYTRQKMEGKNYD